MDGCGRFLSDVEVKTIAKGAVIVNWSVKNIHEKNKFNSKAFSLSEFPDLKFKLHFERNTTFPIIEILLQFDKEYENIASVRGKTEVRIYLGQNFKDMTDCSVCEYNIVKSCVFSDNIRQPFPSDLFNIWCIITIKDDGNSSFTSTSPTADPEKVSVRNLCDDLYTMLDEEIHTDITIAVDGEELKTHRSILAARSSVFHAMFSHDTLEKNKNHVIIEDLSVKTIRHLLQYVYTDKVDEMPIAEYLSLLVAADKYAFPKLKLICTDKIQSNLTSDMALQVLVTAALHQDDNLKTAAVNFIVENASQVTGTPDWIDLLKEHAEIANSVVQALIFKRNSK